jgi:hypothetical protein
MSRSPGIARAVAQDSDASGVAPDAGDAIQRAASSSGSSLPEGVRGRFESSLGVDLSGVRIHTGEDSATAASAVGARAYTIGNDIHFAEGQYAPTDPFGIHLLAHEVAHTVQQGGAQVQRQSVPTTPPLTTSASTATSLPTSSSSTERSATRAMPAPPGPGRTTTRVHDREHTLRQVAERLRDERADMGDDGLPDDIEAALRVLRQANPQITDEHHLRPGQVIHLSASDSEGRTPHSRLQSARDNNTSAGFALPHAEVAGFNIALPQPVTSTSAAHDGTPEGVRAQQRDSLANEENVAELGRRRPTPAENSAAGAQSRREGNRMIDGAIDRYRRRPNPRERDTLQRFAASASPQSTIDVSQPGDALEVEADQAAPAMVAGRPATVSSQSSRFSRDAGPSASPAPTRGLDQLPEYDGPTPQPQPQSSGPSLLARGEEQAFLAAYPEGSMARTFITNYVHGQGAPYHMTVQEMVRCNADVDLTPALMPFVRPMQRARTGGLQQVSSSVLAGAHTHGTLGTFTIRFVGTLEVQPNNKWIFRGTMNWHDYWDFDSHSNGPAGRELLVRIGQLLIGTPFDITSEDVPVAQKSHQAVATWAGGDVGHRAHELPSRLFGGSEGEGEGREDSEAGGREGSETGNDSNAEIDTVGDETHRGRRP